MSETILPKPNELAEVFLFTGATGFIGKRLQRSLAADHPKAKFISIVQSKFFESAKEDGKRLRQDYPSLEYEVIEGDITQSQLRIADPTYAKLLEQTTHFIHLAAIYDLSVPKATAQAVNVLGTQNVIEFCHKAKQSPTLLYFSTCYVSGLRQGTILESELKDEAGFKNHYEATKFEAEVLVRKAMAEKLKAIIIRPGIVVGDSQTGETDKFDGLYFCFASIHSLRRLPTGVPQPKQADAKINLVPVNYLIDAVTLLAKDPHKHLGKTFQIADPKPMLARELYEACCQMITGKKAGLALPLGLLRWLSRIRLLAPILKLNRESLDYFDHPAIFDTQNTQRALDKSQVRCPHISEYLPTLYQYWIQHRKQPGFQAKY